MNSFEGKVAVVTGAGSGIGQQLAVGLARRGARLAVSDVNEEGLANTAAGAAPVIDCDYEARERIIAINLWGVIHGTKEFLPHLIESGDGHVINISSLNGLMAQA